MSRARRTGFAALRLSLLVAMGLVPLACAGTSRGELGKASCTSPTTDAVTGLVKCAEGYQHRPSAKACGTGTGAAAPAEPGTTPLPRANGEDCTVMGCEGFQYGFCRTLMPPGALAADACESGCVVDADCGADAICLCGDVLSPTGGACMYSACRTDQECGENKCLSYAQGPGFVALACQTSADECLLEQDCSDFGPCGFNGTHRICQGPSAVGRPFLVKSTPRVAEVTNRDDWRQALAPLPELDQLSPDQRAEHAAHWAWQGQMEHASIAAFARFNLQLLSLGAPPELIEACTQALADETAHARLCYQLASAYAGASLGPGPLDVSGSLEICSLADVVELVLVEGCFGETRAAAEAREAADTATDPVIAAAYSRIASDEQRHAELAFRFVRWALARDRHAVLPRILAAGQGASVDPVAREVILPCLHALLALDDAAGRQMMPACSSSTSSVDAA